MKIIFLNTWGAEKQDALSKFITEQSPNTDIFCFQEAYLPLINLARTLLAGYTEVERHKFMKGENFIQATYVKNNLPIASSQTVLETDENVGLGLDTKFRIGESDLNVCNFHGVSEPGDKLDNPARIQQSDLLIEYFSDKKGAKIIGGDFNLLPEAKCIQVFEANGYRNLIKEYGITTTRNELAWNLYPGNKQYFSDYVFVSPEVKVKNFTVPTNEVSDHLPMILEIE